jgi:glycosyltransferase involved in cell wall biosynthesis
MSVNEPQLVSVVIPCYNQARFLGEAVESVLAQTHPHFEVVVVDDGSTDETSEVAARYPKVRYFRQENSGRPAAPRNRGLRESHGEYVVFLDSDDRLLPNALEAGLRHLGEHPECAFTSGLCRALSSDGLSLAAVSLPGARNDHYAALLSKNYILTPGAVMFRRAAVEAAGGFDISPEKRGSEDYDLYLRLARASPVHGHDEIVIEYREHDNNLSGDSGQMLKSTLAVLRAQRDFVRGDRGRGEAYRKGLRFYQEFYGDGVVASVRRHARARGEWKQVLRGARLLLRHCPRLLARHAARKLYCVLSGAKTDGVRA